MSKIEDISVIKSTGEAVPFSEDKLKRSLLKSGADENTALYVLEQVEDILYDGITTKKIYQKAFHILKHKKVKPVAARYKLKQAIMELGPSGYPFEKFVGEIFKARGFKVQTGQIMHGQCVKHEVDVIAEKEDLHILVECKFHNNSGYYSNVKIPLYINSRFDDIQKRLSEIPEHNMTTFQGWVVTNTRFTVDALQYGNCIGLHMLSWDFPEKDNLKNIIDSLKLYPVTSLTTLSKNEKQHLLQKGVVLCKHIIEDDSILKQLHINDVKVKDILSECRQLCS